MKKLIITLCMAAILPLMSLAQGWPSGYGGVMLQGFFWDSYKETPDCSPFGPWQYHQTNEATQAHRPGYTWATMYGAGWSVQDEEWQVPVTTWNSLIAHKSEITPYIDIIWLPQSGSTVADSTTIYNGADDSRRNGVRAWRNNGSWDYDAGNTITNPDCMGFVPVFYFHHGLAYKSDGNPWTYTDQSGKTWTPISYFGTEQELRDLISTYKAEGTLSVEDVVANHRGGLGTWSGDANSIEFPTEYYKGQFCPEGEYIEWTSADVCNDDESGQGTGNPDCGGQGTWARDMDHHSPATRAKMIKFLDYLKNDLGYAGFRYDYAMGFEEKHFAEYNLALRPTFSVGEYWGSKENIESWIKKTYAEGAYQSAAFDFPLMNQINEAFNWGNYRALDGGGLIHDSEFKRYAVTFVDNHDTFKDLPTDGSNFDWSTGKGYQHRTNSHIVEANAFILMMPGTPCLFYPHFMHPSWHNDICTLIKIRRTAGIHNESTRGDMETWGSDGASWRVTGTKGEVYYQVGSNISSAPIPSGFTVAWTGAVARVLITSSLADEVASNTKQNLVNGYPVIDKASGSYNSAITVNIKPSTEGCTIVYTTDGHTPNAHSKQVTDANGVNINISETSTVKAAVLIDGEVVTSSIITREYVIDSSVNTGQVKLYVKVNGATENNHPYVYAWDNNENSLTGAWPGWGLYPYTKEIGGVVWYEATFNVSEINMILSWGNDASKTADITGVRGTVFYTFEYGTAHDLTSTYINALINPTVSIDKASGEYAVASLTPTLTASNEDAVIVYTIDGSEPTTSSPQFTHSGTVTFNRTSPSGNNFTLRAGILHNGQVINQVARTYRLIDGTDWEPNAVETDGFNIYIHTNNDVAPYLYAWDPATNTAINGLYNGTIMSDFRRVTLNSNNTSKTYYYKHFDNDAVTGGALGFLVSFNGDTDKSADTNLPKPGNYFFDYNGTPGAALTDNSSSYWSTTTSNTGNNTVNENGINLYVRSTDGSAPYLHTWTGSNNAPRRVATKTTGDDKPALYIPEVTQVINNTTWYYVHSDESSLNFLVAADGAYGHQSSNQTVTAGGVKFYTYNPSNGNIEDKTSDFYTIQGATPTPSTTGKITVLVRDMSNDNAIPYMHYWGTGSDSSAPVQLTDYVTIDGHKWFYKQFNSLTGVIIAQNSSWANKTADMKSDVTGISYSTGNYYFLEYYPNGSGWKCNPNNSSDYIPLLPTSGGTQFINFTQTTRLTTSNALYTEESGTAATDTSDPLPSCATYVPGNQPYFYFENDGHFIMPCAWVWNGTSVFSGHSWPGEQLVEMVGTANNGNTVYRWLYDGENTSTPQSVIFNDNGSNSTGTFTYERGAYYNTSGKVGVVTNSTVSLADLVKYGVSGEKYTIANDLVCALVNKNGEYLFAKDNAGDAILQSYKTEGQLDYNYYQNKEDYDQSNWIKIKLPDVTGTTAIDKFSNRVLLSGTVIGTFTLENGNPMITVQAHPVVGKPSFYTPNTYIPTNFTGDNDYYFITPKPQEYCKVIWAVYNNGTFSVPEKCVIDGVSINSANLSGTFDAVIDSEFDDSGITLQNNHIYELTGVVQTKQNVLRQAPRRTEIYPHSGEASPTYGFVMTGATDRSNEIVTHVGNQIGDRTVESVTYFNVMGVASNEPMEGINIVVTRYSDGTSSTHKIIKR